MKLNPRKAKIRYKQMYRLYKMETNEERIHEFENILYYLELEMNNKIECNWQPGEGCQDCYYNGRCDL